MRGDTVNHSTGSGISPAGNCGSSGSSLMEMVVVLVILSLLAAVATPYARKTLRREKEMQLRETLRTVRIAIDRFHADVDGKSAAEGQHRNQREWIPAVAASSRQWRRKRPRDKIRKRYLRSLPVNPFASASTPLEAQWTFVSSQREGSFIASSSYGTTLAEAQNMQQKDIYDLHAVTKEIALDGTRYADW